MPRSDETSPVPAVSARIVPTILRRVVLCVALLAAVCTAAGPAGAQESDALAQLERDVVELHNQERRARGLGPLTVHAALNAAAREWAAGMAADGHASHRPEYWTHSCDRTGSWQRCAENVAAGYRDARSVHDAWMGSSTHRSAILAPDHNRMAVGVWVADDGRLYWAAYFMDGTTAATSAPPPHPQDCPSTAAYDPDGASGTVYRLYRAYFLRDPDLQGYEYWLCQFHHGTPVTDIAEAFAASQEYRAKYGNSTNVEYVDLIYANVLGRPGDAAGRQYWIDELGRGTSRGEVMIAFSDSAEFRAATADGRPPTG